MRKLTTSEAQRVLKIINTKCWNIHTDNKKKNIKPLSIHKIIDNMVAEKDWNDIATKCSNNPQHEYFGKSAEWILEEWKNRGTKSSTIGVGLDNYIQAYLKSGAEITITDKKLERKCKRWRLYYETVLNKHMTHIGSEIWINSPSHFRGRIDELMGCINDNNELLLLVIDWKSVDVWQDSNDWNKMINCCSNLDECKANNFTIQTQLYKYALEELGFKDVVTRIVQVSEIEVTAHKENFPYDKGLINDMIEFSKQKN